MRRRTSSSRPSSRSSRRTMPDAVYGLGGATERHGIICGSSMDRQTAGSASGSPGSGSTCTTPASCGASASVAGGSTATTSGDDDGSCPGLGVQATAPAPVTARARNWFRLARIRSLMVRSVMRASSCTRRTRRSSVSTSPERLSAHSALSPHGTNRSSRTTRTFGSPRRPPPCTAPLAPCTSPSCDTAPTRRNPRPC